MKFTRNLRRLFFAVGLLLAIVPVTTSRAQSIHLSIPDTSEIKGNTLKLPILTTDIAKDSAVVAGSFTFGLNEDIFRITGFDKTGTLLESISNVVFNTGTNTLAFAGTDTLEGSGVLVYLTLQIEPGANYFNYTDLTFSSASLNEGTPSVTTEGGRLTVKGISISPRSGLQPLEGDSIQFSVTGYGVGPYSWSVTDPTIASIDTTGLFRAIKPGLVQVKAFDSQGLRDSTQYFRVQPITLQELAITIPDTSVRQTKSFLLPVLASDLTGLQVLSAEINLQYDENDLTFNGVTAANALTEAWGEPTVNIVNGTIEIASAGTDTLAGSGALFYVNFTVKENAGGSSNINISHAALNEELEAELFNGRFTVLAAPDIQVNIADTAVSIGDELSFAVTGGNGEAPYHWITSDETIATIDSLTGQFEALSRGDVIINAVDVDGFRSSDVNVRVNDFDAYIDTQTVSYPDTITVAIKTTDLSLYNLLSFQSSVKYDTTRLEYLGFSTDGTMSSGSSVEVLDSLDYLNIASAGTSFLGGSEEVLKLRFHQKEAVMHRDTMMFDLSYLTFDEPGPSVPTTTAQPGYVDVIRINPPVTPVSLNPLDNAVDQDTSLTLSWAASENAGSYTLSLSTDSLFASTIVDSSLTGTEMLVSGLDYLTEYYWRVKAENLGGTSDWSDTLSFKTIIEKPALPELLSPMDSLVGTDTTMTFMWTASDRADQYLLQLSRDETFTTVDREEPLADTMAILHSLDFSTDYYWRVNAENTGGESGFTASRTFRTKAIPAGIPMLTSPLDGLTGTDTTLVLNWETAEGALNYEYRVSTDSTFQTVSYTDTTGSTSEAPLTGLDFLTEYHWQVRAFGAEDTSAWSEPFSFTTKIEAPETPMLVSPADSVSEQPVTLELSWNEAARAESYIVEVSTDSAFATFHIQDMVSDTSFIATGLDYLTDYYWRVRSTNSTGESDYSERRTFQTKALDASVPVLLEPAFGAADLDTAVVLRWSMALGTINYELQVDTTAVFDAPSITANTPDTLYAIEALSYETQYFWRVRGIGAQDTSDWSAIYEFTTKPGAPESPVLISPADSAKQQLTTLDLIWGMVPHADSYTIQVATDEGFSSLITDDSVADTSFTISGLDYFTDYYWRVKAVNGTGESDFSEPSTFRTKALDASVPVLLSPLNGQINADTTVSLVWSATDGAVNYEYAVSKELAFGTLLAGGVITDTSVVVNGLEFHTEYFWKVRSIGLESDTSDWSSTFTFTTKFDELPAPVLLEPADETELASDSASFRWSSVDEAVEYTFSLYSDTTSTPDVEEMGIDTMLTVNGLMYETKYYWRVQSADTANSRISVWSGWNSFSTPVAPDEAPIVASALIDVELDEDFGIDTVAVLSDHFEDPEGESLSFDIVSSPGFLLIELQSDTLIFHSKQDSSGTGEIVLRATDPGGQSVTDTMMVTVNPVNDAPFIIQIPDTLEFTTNDTLSLVLDSSFADIEDALSDLDVQVVVDPSDVILTFDPNTLEITLSSPVYTGLGSVTLTVTDTEGASVQVILILNIKLGTSSEINDEVPDEFSLNQNYPNPFNPTSTISFGIPKAGEVRLEVYNMLGQKVSTLIDQKMQAGWHSVQFDASGLSSGTYIYRIQSGSFVQTEKMMLIK